MNELSIPPIAKDDPNSGEVLRAWIAQQGLHVSLHVDAWDDVATWGIFLADILRHIALAYEQAHFVPRGDVMKKIQDTFNAEIKMPTDLPQGSIVRLH